ncbi:hypothetical protein JL722_709 [Aureococcus anophagefferens]|nr:hypothetical protein JL722_709 [Aureococcus anophagefferens]
MQQRKRTLTDPEDKAAAAKMDPVTASPLLAPSAAIAEIDDDFVLEPEKAGLPTARSWCACATLSLSVLLCMSTWLSSSVVLQYLVDAFSVSEGHGSFFTIAVQLGFVACCLAQAGTQLPDRANCRWLMCFGGLLAVAANLAMLACRAFWQALLARFATGVAMALVYPPATKVLATCGLANLVKAVPGSAELWATRRGFVLLTLATSGATVVGAALPVLFVADGPFALPPSTFKVENLARIAGNKKAVLAILGYMGHSWELYGAWSWLPHFLGSEVFEPQAAALLSFAAIAVGAVSCVALGDCGDRYGRCKIPSTTSVTELVEPELVGTALVVNQALGFVATIPAIFLVNQVAGVGAIGWRFAFASLAPGALLAVAFMERLDRLAAPKAAALAPDSDDRRFVAAA